jgi:hypothetical protein
MNSMEGNSVLKGEREEASKIAKVDSAPAVAESEEEAVKVPAVAESEEEAVKVPAVAESEAVEIQVCQFGIYTCIQMDDPNVRIRHNPRHKLRILSLMLTGCIDCIPCRDSYFCAMQSNQQDKYTDHRLCRLPSRN